MSALRLSDDNSLDDDDLQAELSESESSSQVMNGKSAGRPGRPRGKGRPRRSSKLAKKKSEESEQWQERIKVVRERINVGKQQSSIEGYIKIIDYLKKIDYEQGNIQNKMNPYNALTATCFWYAVSADYFSYDFFSKKNPHDVSMEVLDKVHKIPLVFPNRVLKTPTESELLAFQTPELNALGKQQAEKMASLIPAPLPGRPEVVQKKTAISTVAEDDQFISSTRAILYNYITKKVKNSEKWSSLLTNFSKEIQELPEKQFEKLPQVSFQVEEQEQETNLFELLRQQAKKKIQKRQKKKEKPENQIFQEEQRKDDGIFRESEQQKDKLQQKQKSNEVQNMVDEKQNQDKKEVEQEKEQQMDIQLNKAPNQPQETATFKKIYTEQDLLLDSILQLPLDKVISILQSSIPTIQLPEITQSFMPISTKDPLEFVYQLHPEEEQYLEYMKAYRKKKYKEKVAKIEGNQEQQEKQGQYQDAKCQICTDGDYTDDNLIVFCSMCNISLHQRCVGLAKVPAESWVCDVCLAFGPAGINLPCPLCNVKGGAMKRTNIHIDINLFKETNPGYYEYSKKCPYNKQKQEYIPKEKVEGQVQSQNQEKEEGIVKVVRQKGEKQEECYYDYFVKSTYPTQIPVCHYVWVHYVCAIWVPECYFQQKNGNISIKGIQNIEKKRFKYECFVCKKNKCGAAVKCEDSECDKYYHPQCARKKKVYMQQLNLQKLKYLIFCEEHEPLKITRQIQYKKKKNREEIIKFARMIQKYIETYRIAQFPFKLLKSAVPSTFIETVQRHEREDHKQTRRNTVAAGSDEQFLRQLMTNLSKAKMMTVHLEKVENGFKITNIQTPSKRQIRKCLNRYDQFWNSIKNGETNEENFRRYERIMMDNQKLKEKLQLFLSGNQSARGKGEEKKEKKVGKKRGKHAAQPVQTLIQQEGGIFCVCKKPYQGETNMVQCEVCCEWYHYSCLGFIGSEEDAQTMEFKCMKCMKFEQGQAKQQRLRRYQLLFSKDSILYNYRPPTPELMSQEEVQQKNYTEIMEQAKKVKDFYNSSPVKPKIQSVSQRKKATEPLEEMIDENKQIYKVPETIELKEVSIAVQKSMENNQSNEVKQEVRAKEENTIKEEKQSEMIQLGNQKEASAENVLQKGQLEKIEKAVVDNPIEQE